MKEELIEYWTTSGIVKDQRLIEAFREIRREDFIKPELAEDAYHDIPLPIGFGQTISQPTTIMVMLQALSIDEGDIVLEVGAGTGYSAALMARLAKEVYSTEQIQELAEKAKENLKKAGISNCQVICADGSMGLEEKAPFDRIIVTCAAPHLPEPLVEQLKDGGIIVAPIGNRDSQTMIVARKAKEELKTESIGNFRFVPLIGKYGYNS